MNNTLLHKHVDLCARYRKLDTAMRWAIALLVCGLFCLGMSVVTARAQSSQWNPSYPPRATAVTGVFSGADTTTASATLTGSPGQWTYICGFSVSGLGATALNNATVTVGTLTGGNTATYSYAMPLGATVIAVPVNITFSPCVPANAIGASLTVTVAGATGAGNTLTNIVATGYLFPNP